MASQGYFPYESQSEHGSQSEPRAVGHDCLDSFQNQRLLKSSSAGRVHQPPRSAEAVYPRPDAPTEYSLIRLVVPTRPTGCPATTTMLCPGLSHPGGRRVWSTTFNIASADSASGDKTGRTP